jgi:uncharacterized membrane protein YgcG
MKRIITALAVAAIGLSLAACEPSHRTHKQVVAVKHLKDGRWAYQDSSSNDWFFYYVIMTDQSRSYYTGSSAPTVGSEVTASNGAQGTVNIAEAEPGTEPSASEIAEAESVSVEIEVVGEGEPATAAEVEASNAEGGPESAGEASSDSSAGSDSSSSSSDGGSSGGDSGGGGGGDGGGGGGGGDGG